MKLELKIGTMKTKLPPVQVSAGTTANTPIKLKLNAKTKKKITAALKAKKKVTVTAVLTNAVGTSAPAILRLK